MTLWESWYASACVCVLESVRVSAWVCVPACVLGEHRSWIWDYLFWKDFPDDSASHIYFA